MARRIIVTIDLTYNTDDLEPEAVANEMASEATCFDGFELNHVRVEEVK